MLWIVEEIENREVVFVELMCYIRKGLIRRLSEHVEWLYLHARGRVYLGRVTLFADNASLGCSGESYGWLANSCDSIQVCETVFDDCTRT